MADPIVNCYEFPHLKEYGRFLLSNCLNETALESIKISREVKLPLLNLFSHLSEEQLVNFSKQTLGEFFEQLSKEEAYESTKETILQWKSGTHPLIPKDTVKATDISLVYHTRKLLLLNFIPRFTNEPATILAIAKEIENFYVRVEQFAFQTFLEIRKEEQEAYTQELQQQQGELEATNEKLRAYQKELTETNEKLREQVSIRRVAEETLEKERNYLQAVLENIGDGIVACDAQGSLALFNGAARNFLGLSRIPLPAKAWSSYYQLYHMDGETPLKKEEEPLYRAYKGEYISHAEIVIVPTKGQKRLLHAKGQPILSSQGKQLGAVVVLHDITQIKALQQEQKLIIQELHEKNKDLATALEELQAAEEQLLEVNNELEARIQRRTKELQYSEQQMRLITDALPVLITYVDAEERYRFNNKAYETWFKRPRAEVYGKKLEEVLGTAAYEKIKDVVQRVLKGEVVHLETKLHYKDAGQKYVSVNYIPHTVGEKVVGYFALITDISEHKKAQEELEKANKNIIISLDREKAAYAEAQAQRSRLYNLFMQTPSLLSIVRGEDFVFELANPHYLEMLGIHTPIEGKPLAEVIPNLDPSVMEVLHNVFHRGERFIGNEFPVMSDWNKDKQPYTRYFNLIYEPVKETDGRVSGLITFGYEVTEQVKARQSLEESTQQLNDLNLRLNKKNNQLKKINTDLDNFIYTASHDLKNPIINLEGLISMLRAQLEQKMDAREHTLFEMADRSIQKLKQTIVDLTEITKVQKDMENHPEKLSFEKVLDNVKEGIQADIKKSNAMIKVELGVSEIMYSKNNLRSILYNLLSNAIKYSSQDRPTAITIKTYKEDEYVVLSVEDNGLGLSEKQQEKLFIMFKRLHSHVEGTGIGLYIIKRIVENRGGRIEVESKLDCGTTFRVYFKSDEKVDNY